MGEGELPVSDEWLDDGIASLATKMLVTIAQARKSDVIKAAEELEYLATCPNGFRDPAKMASLYVGLAKLFREHAQ